MINHNAFTYQAPNPYPPTFWSRLTAWLPSVSTSASESSEASLGQLILPAQQRNAITISDLALKSYANNLDFNFGVVNTHDGAKISTMEIKPQRSSDIYIIKCNGNGTLFEEMVDEFSNDAQKLEANVIGFNYRGVGKSKGDTGNDRATIFKKLVTDGIAQVQRLLDRGVPAKKIQLDGHSLGGAVATEVAAHFHRKKQRVYLWNSCSFASLSQAAAGILNQCNLPGSVETTSAYGSASFMKPLGWEVNPARSYLSIPSEYRGYIVVSKKSGDGVISHNASLHMGVKADEKKQGKSTGHKVKTLNSEAGHNAGRHRLFNTKNVSQSAQDLYEEFVTSHLGNIVKL